ncbi:MAG TPA: class I SAM-dependent methyltransferase [Dermatophilaceae bacterium]
MDEYMKANRANWDQRAPAHAMSPGYNVQRFIDDPAFIGEVVRFDRVRLGDLRGLRGVHLQCHIGTDTIGLSRLGARMTGLDFSPAAIEQARILVAKSGDDVTFVESNVYDAASALSGEQFDLVFTGIGALCWLPSISRWAAAVAALLKPGGRLFIREGHPMLWSLTDARPDGLLVVDLPYFERDEPSVWEDGGTYVETDVVFTANTTHEWNHGLGEIVTALIAQGLQITGLVEHESVPWEALLGQMTNDDRGEWRLTERPWRLAANYTLQAVKSS